MVKEFDEKRVNPRYKADVDLQFLYAYDLEADLEYSHKEEGQKQTKKYLARSRNISSQGVSFVAAHEVKHGDELVVDIIMPGMSAVSMQGCVRWCKQSENIREGDFNYVVGLEVTKVKGKPVLETVYYDQDYHVYWSLVLEAVLGGYRIYSQNKKSSEG